MSPSSGPTKLELTRCYHLDASEALLAISSSPSISNWSTDIRAHVNSSANYSPLKPTASSSIFTKPYYQPSFLSHFNRLRPLAVRYSHMDFLRDAFWIHSCLFARCTSEILRTFIFHFRRIPQICNVLTQAPTPLKCPSLPHRISLHLEGCPSYSLIDSVVRQLTPLAMTTHYLSQILCRSLNYTASMCSILMQTFSSTMTPFSSWIALLCPPDPHTIHATASEFAALPGLRSLQKIGIARVRNPGLSALVDCLVRYTVRCPS